MWRYTKEREKEPRPGKDGSRPLYSPTGFCFGLDFTTLRTLRKKAGLLFVPPSEPGHRLRFLCDASDWFLFAGSNDHRRAGSPGNDGGNYHKKTGRSGSPSRPRRPYRQDTHTTDHRTGLIPPSSISKIYNPALLFCVSFFLAFGYLLCNSSDTQFGGKTILFCSFVQRFVHWRLGIGSSVFNTQTSDWTTPERETSSGGWKG